MIRCVATTFGVIVFTSISGFSEIRTWRIGDTEHPWNLSPVSGRIDLGRSWAVELLADDDGDGLIDEDAVELIDNDGDGMINEDPVDIQVDNDGDGTINEDPINNLDDDGDGQIDEDPREAFDADYDGLIDEDGPDPQIDNDGDGLFGEDGLYSDFDDDYDGQQNEDPPNGIDDDNDGLIDEDGTLPLHDSKTNKTTWLQPVRLDSLRNLAYLVNQRFLNGEYGGIVPGKQPGRPFMIVPSENGFRNETADPISPDYWATSAVIGRSDATLMVDNDLATAYGSALKERGGVGINLMGFYNINRIIFRPRPTLPDATIANYYIRVGDPSTINPRIQGIEAKNILVPVVNGQYNPSVKDLKFNPPNLMGRVDIVSTDPSGVRVETAEAQIYGEGFPTDAVYISEMIDVGTEIPRIRRYDREIEQFSTSEDTKYFSQFPTDTEGDIVNWGKVRWRGRRIGGDEGDVRIQFRVGNTLDTHLYARKLGPGLSDTRDENGRTLSLFDWIKLTDGRIQTRELQYNELGADLGSDGNEGWSFWSAPFKYEDGLIDENLPEDEWGKSGIQLPLPGGTRYIQFRILFDSTIESAVQLDFIEFEYDTPLVSGGVVAEIFPPQVEIGEETEFRYFLRPLFAKNEATVFNRIEIAIPSTDTKVDSLFFDGQLWDEIPINQNISRLTENTDPLLDIEVDRSSTDAGESIGKFAQSIVADPITQTAKLIIKISPMRASDFEFGQNIEVVFRSKLFRGSKEFTSSVWNDETGNQNLTIPQPTKGGDATPDVATDALLVVVNQIEQVSTKPILSANPFSPNGDGINDEVRITFDLFLVLDQIDTTLEIYDLSGRQVRSIETNKLSAGSVDITWDGKDSNGELVSPGLYMYQLNVGSDNSDDVHSGILSLVY